jgi:rhamnosyltransferase subunit B
VLQARGHDVVLAVPEYYRPQVEPEGLGFHPAGLNIDPEADRERVAQVMDPARGPEYLLRTMLMPAVARTYEELVPVVRGADLLVAHPITFAAPLVAETLRVPWVSTVLAPLSLFSAHDPFVVAAAPWLVHARHAGTWVGKAFVTLVKRITRDWAAPVRELRASLGLPPAGHPIFDGQFSPMLTLALFSPVMASPRPDWPAHTRTTGFVFYNGQDVLSAELEAFLNSGTPPIVFTLGSSAVLAPGEFYEESAAAAATLGARAVLLVGPFENNRPARTLSPDILCVDRAPHQLLFPRASVVVHQGGVGTTGQGLRSGRPTLIVPHAHDQPDNAYRVAQLGVSRTLYPRPYRARRVARELDMLLREPAYAARATEVARVVRQENGAGDAADAIEEMLSR